MEFVIEDRVFEILPNVCFGVVVARGINNYGRYETIYRMLEESMRTAAEKFAGVKLKEHPDIVCYREAFKKLGFNPNKFLNSVEAMISRIIKGGKLPDINNVVNLVNAISLKYTLPMGAHDMEQITGNIEVRFSRKGEPFTPFGCSEPEFVDEGELVYADERMVKTRRWIWRQSDIGKVTEDTTDIFFPIDGFSDHNKESVLQARDELACCIENFFHVKPQVFFLDAGTRSVVIG